MVPVLSSKLGSPLAASASVLVGFSIVAVFSICMISLAKLKRAVLSRIQGLELQAGMEEAER